MRTLTPTQRFPKVPISQQGHKLKVYNVGLSYKPHPLVAIKTDYARLNYSPNRRMKTNTG
jgi:hypothetical protein